MPDKDRLTMLTRLGFATRALLYIAIALLLLTKGRTEDPTSVLAHLGQGGGRILLLLMTLGLAAYGLWRLADGLFNIEHHGQAKSDLAERAGGVGSGLFHLFLAWQALRLVRGAGAASETQAQDGAQSVLSLPGGGTLLTIGGLVLLAAGAFQIVKAVKASYLETLDPRIARQAWAKWSGRLGYAARGLVFLICGFFLVRAGLDEQASEVGGMAEALKWLTSPWDVVIALGLLAFGMFSLIEARFRRIGGAGGK